MVPRRDKAYIVNCKFVLMPDCNYSLFNLTNDKVCLETKSPRDLWQLAVRLSRLRRCTLVFHGTFQ